MTTVEHPFFTEIHPRALRWRKVVVFCWASSKLAGLYPPRLG